MSNSVAIQNSICEAINNIVSTVANNYDRTVQATVLKCEDESLGKYKVMYQDSVFYAYTTNLSEIYTENTNVYINIPNNDMNQEKTILGSVKKLGSLSIVEDADLYITNGKKLNYEGNISLPLIENKYSFICSISGEDKIKEFVNTILQSKYLKMSYFVRTVNFTDIERHTNGYYGVKMYLNSGKALTKSTTTEEIEKLEKEEELIELIDFNIDKFIGNPYKLNEQIEQSAVFLLDNSLPFDNFTEIDFIGYIKDFNIEEGSNSEVEIENISLSSISPLPSEDTTGTKLYIQTPKGNSFSSNTPEGMELTLEGNVKENGITKDNSNLQCYWFEQDSSITASSDGYSSYGGAGWRCLNEYDEDTQAYTPLPASYAISKDDVPAAQKEYKCVGIYNSLVLTATTIIKNLGVKDTISIDSYTIQKLEQMQTYYFAKHNDDKEKLSNQEPEKGYFVKWYFINSAKVSQYCDPNPPGSKIYSFEGNAIFLDTKKIIGKGTLKAELYYKSDTGSITYLTNTSIEISGGSADSDATLIINNREQVFLYDSDGNSPLSEKAEYPSVIYPLSFSLYDKDGKDITSEVEDIEWRVPNKNTLIKVESGEKEGNNQIVKTNSLIFSIEDSYSDNHLYDNIYLTVFIKKDGKTKTYTANTNFSFVQEGEVGTAGDGTYCRLVLNSLEGFEEPLYPMVTIQGNNTSTENSQYLLNYKLSDLQSDILESGQKYNLFRGQLWKQNEKLYDNFKYDDTSKASISWSIPNRNEKESNQIFYEIDEANGEITISRSFNSSQLFSRDTLNLIFSATIIKDSKTYTAIIPVAAIKEEYKVGFDTEDFNIEINDTQKPFWIFNYDSNGELKNPKRSSFSFAYQDTQLTIQHAYYNLLSNNSLNQEGNNVTVIPNKYYKTEKYHDSFTVYATYGAIESGKYFASYIKIPICSVMNQASEIIAAGWQGGTAKVNEEEGTILAETIAAGIKNKDNSFTGAIIGKKDQDEIGILGYNEGKRSIFLDSTKGAAILGETRDKQIFIETEDDSIIHSGNYDENSGVGLQIDFIVPSIKFGDEDFFSVDKNSEESILSNWHISNPSITSDSKEIGISYNTDLDFNFSKSDRRDNRIDCYLPIETKSKIQNRTRTFWNENFYITSDGVLKTSYAMFGERGDIYIGKDGSGEKNSALIFGEKTSLTEDGLNGLYLSKNAIALGNKIPGTDAHNFYVTSKGHIISRQIEVKDKVNEDGWVIDSKQISYKPISFINNNDGAGPEQAIQLSYSSNTTTLALYRPLNTIGDPNPNYFFKVIGDPVSVKLECRGAGKFYTNGAINFTTIDGYGITSSDNEYYYNFTKMNIPGFSVSKDTGTVKITYSTKISNNLTSNSAIIENNISAGSATVTGEITANSATIGGVVFSNNNDTSITRNDEPLIITSNKGIELSAAGGNGVIILDSNGIYTNVGASGDFESADGKKITVKSGLITNIS